MDKLCQKALQYLIIYSSSSAACEQERTSRFQGVCENRQIFAGKPLGFPENFDLQNFRNTDYIASPFFLVSPNRLLSQSCFAPLGKSIFDEFLWGEAQESADFSSRVTQKGAEIDRREAYGVRVHLGYSDHLALLAFFCVIFAEFSFFVAFYGMVVYNRRNEKEREDRYDSKCVEKR